MADETSRLDDNNRATLTGQTPGGEIRNIQTSEAGGLNIEKHWPDWENITSNTTTTVVEGSGVLGGISINTAGASSNTITIYDNTAGSGDKIATIDGTQLGAIDLEGIPFDTGLTIVTATGTAADITVKARAD